MAIASLDTSSPWTWPRSPSADVKSAHRPFSNSGLPHGGMTVRRGPRCPGCDRRDSGLSDDGELAVTTARAMGGYAGTRPMSVQVSQISWPRCRLLGVAVQACPIAQISATGVVMPL